jgi:trigger factor
MSKMVQSQFENDLTYVVDYLVDAKEYQDFKNRIVEQLYAKVEVPGFRPGKAPEKLLKQHVSDQAVASTVLQETLEKYGNQAIGEMQTVLKEQNRVPVGYQADMTPEVTKETEDGGFQFRLKANLLPQVDLDALDKIKLTKYTAKDVTNRPSFEDFVSSEKKKVLAGYNTYEESQKAAGDDSQIICNMSGTIDGKPEPKLNAQEAVISLNSGEYLPDFVKGLKGVKAGETRTFPVKFPDNYFEPSLAGKKAEFTVEVIAVKTPKATDLKGLFSDDTEANKPLKAQFKTEADLDTYLKNYYDSETRRQIRELQEREVIRKVVTDTPNFSIPETSVNKEVERLMGVLKEDAENKKVTVAEAFAATGLPGSDDPKITSYTDKKIQDVVKDYVYNEFKLSHLLSYIFETQVTDKPTSEQLENTIKEVTKAPQNFGMSKDAGPEEIRRGVNDRVVRQSAANWLFKKLIPNEEAKEKEGK